MEIGNAAHAVDYSNVLCLDNFNLFLGNFT